MKVDSDQRRTRTDLTKRRPVLDLRACFHYWKIEGSTELGTRDDRRFALTVPTVHRVNLPGRRSSRP